MEWKLERVTKKDQEVLYRLLQYSLFEESGTDSNEMNQDGTFSYEWFDAYFSDDSRDAYLIRKSDSNQLLGFVMVNEHLERFQDGHSIAEFMVIPKYRRKGIGRKVAVSIFEKYPGNWEVRPAYGSEKAYLFRRNVIEGYMHQEFLYEDSIFLFTNGTKRMK